MKPPRSVFMLYAAGEADVKQDASAPVPYAPAPVVEAMNLSAGAAPKFVVRHAC